jgi:hypothetical protein
MLNENTPPAPEWWIKFTPDNGKIFQISPRQIALSDADESRGIAVVKTDNQLCQKVTTNRIGLRRVIMLPDPINGEFSIAEKSRRLDLSSESSIDSVKNFQISKLKKQSTADSAVTVSIHTNSRTVTLEINEAMIRRKLGLSEIHEVANSGNERIMDLYISQADNPDFLEHTVKINIPELFRTGRFKAFLPEDLDTEHVSIWTVKVLGDYDLITEQDLVEPDAVLRPFANIQRVLNSNNPAHVTITKTSDGIVLKSSMSDATKYPAVASKQLHFIVSSSTIDHIVGTFSVNTSDFFQQEDTLVKLNFDWPESPVIAYKNKYLVVNYQGEANG